MQRKYLTMMMILLHQIAGLSPGPHNFRASPNPDGSSGKIILNEIFPDPSPSAGLPLVEYIELYNAGNTSVNLCNWTLSDPHTMTHLHGLTLSPDDYLILCPASSGNAFREYGKTMELSPFPKLNNGGDCLKLSDNHGRTMDSITYQSNWYGTDKKSRGGWSLERADPFHTCTASFNWKASVNPRGGSPGKINSVFTIQPDTLGPAVNRVLVEDSNTISLHVNESVSAAVITVSSLFSTGGHAMHGVDSMALQDTVVRISLNKPFISGEVIKIRIRKLSDPCGNEMKDTLIERVYYVPRPFDVLFSEIMADPDPRLGLPEYEYIELFNRSKYPVQARDWKLVTGSAGRTLPDCIIHSGEHVILCSQQARPALEKYGKTIAMERFPTLKNTGQLLSLRNEKNQMIHFIDYHMEWYRDEFKKHGGWAMEQIDPNNPCGMGDNWTASEDPKGGTPGNINSVYQENPDTKPPGVERIVVRQDSSIRVVFTEPMSSHSMNQPSSYRLSRDPAHPDNITPLAPGYRSVLLSFNQPFRRQTIYTLFAGDPLCDCSGNPMGPENTGRFAIPDSARENDMVINELLFHPFAGNSGFIEIYNRSGRVFDLNDYQIAIIDIQANKLKALVKLSPHSRLFFPDEYMAFTEKPHSLANRYPYSNPKHITGLNPLPSFPDKEGRIILMSAGMAVIDDFSYSSDMHLPVISDTKGISLERIHPEMPTNEPANWQSAARSSGYATPAHKNSQFSEYIRPDNSLSLRKDIFSPDQDGREDVLYLDYHFDEPGYTGTFMVFDVRGRLVKKLMVNAVLPRQGSIHWNGFTQNNRPAKIGVYTLYIRIWNEQGRVREYKKPFVLARKL